MGTLQFIEKLMKGLIYEKTGNTTYTHKLLKLNSELYQTTALRLDEPLLETIICEASVRYDSNLIMQKDAIISHINSMKLFSKLMSYIE